MTKVDAPRVVQVGLDGRHQVVQAVSVQQAAARVDACNRVQPRHAFVQSRQEFARSPWLGLLCS